MGSPGSKLIWSKSALSVVVMVIVPDVPFGSPVPCVGLPKLKVGVSVSGRQNSAASRAIRA